MLLKGLRKSVIVLEQHLALLTFEGTSSLTSAFQAMMAALTWFVERGVRSADISDRVRGVKSKASEAGEGVRCRC